MRPLRSLLAYTVFVFVGGALLAPPLYWLAQSWQASGQHTVIPFHRFVDRSLLILALVGIWPLLRSLGGRSSEDVGLAPPVREWHRWPAGFLLGFLSLALVALIVLAVHGRVLNTSLGASQLAKKLGGAAAAALIVSVIEEILFRGAIFGALRRVWGWRAALVVSSMIYAIVHFLEKAEITGPITWTSGLELLPRMLRGFGDLHAIIPGFFSLTLAGILLGWAYQRTGNLYFSMGLHAGWIFWLKSYGMFTNESPGAATWLFGTYKLIDGWLALLILGLALFILPQMATVDSRGNKGAREK